MSEDLLASITAKKEAEIARMQTIAKELQQLQKQAQALVKAFREKEIKVKTYAELEREIMGDAAAPPNRVTLDDSAGGGP